MQLLITVIQAADADDLRARLIEQGIRFTRLGSTGGFLGLGNETMLIGVEQERVPDVMAAIRETCHTRRQYVNALAWSADVANIVTPVEVEVGGASVFRIPVQRFLQMRGGAAPSGEYAAPGSTTPGGIAMRLVIAIIQKDSVDKVTEAVIQAGHRLTRIDTTGGFLRKGNATLLIGVEAPKVDEVLGLIQSALPVQSGPSPVQKGMPMYGATVFVLETAGFVRV